MPRPRVLKAAFDACGQINKVYVYLSDAYSKHLLTKVNRVTYEITLPINSHLAALTN